MVQSSCDGGGGGVEWSRGELSCNGGVESSRVQVS